MSKPLTARGQQMLAAIEAQSRSGQTVREFCRDQTIPLATFTWWKYRLRKMSALTSAVTEPPRFIKITPAVPVSPAAPGCYELCFGDGRTLRMPLTLAVADVAVLVREIRAA